MRAAVQGVEDPGALADAVRASRQQLRGSALKGFVQSLPTRQSTKALSKHLALMAEESAHGRPTGASGSSGGTAGVGPVPVAPPGLQGFAKSEGMSSAGRLALQYAHLDQVDGEFRSVENTWRVELQPGDLIKFRYARGGRAGELRVVRALRLLNMEKALLRLDDSQLGP